MKIGVVANVLQDKPLAEALKIFKEMGIEQIEPGCGGFAGKAHVNPEHLLADPAALENFRQTIEDSGMTISALMQTGTASRGSHMSTSIAKEATGVAFTTDIAGASSASKARNRVQSAASATPATAAVAMPSVTRARDAKV